MPYLVIPNGHGSSSSQSAAANGCELSTTKTAYLPLGKDVTSSEAILGDD